MASKLAATIGFLLAGTAAYAGAVAVQKTIGGVMDQQDVILNLTGTYSYTLQAASPSANATDLILFQGSSTKTVRIKYIAVRGFASSGGSLPVYLVRRSGIGDVGGVSQSIAWSKMDQTSDLSATATVGYYTTAPTTLGNVLGSNQSALLGAQRAQLATAGTVNVPAQWNPGGYNLKAFTLHGTTDFLAVNLSNAQAPAGAILEIEMVTEEE
jgi:hypothetical protein